MKTCFKCHETKPFTEFYGHPQMADGLLGKCKSCTKADTARRHAEKIQNPIWRAEERARHRAKTAKARRLGKISPYFEVGRKRWEEKNQHKKRAQGIVARAIRSGTLTRLPCEVCGDPNSHGHHPDYSKPLDVWWLCPTHHGQAHWKDNPLVLDRAKAPQPSESRP